MTRNELVAYLDDYLKVAAIPDNSPNGLQVEGRSEVKRIVVAVDACLQTIRAAARSRADMLIVHHGLFWGRHEQITGVMRGRIAALIKSEMSLYTAHIPLDCHDEVGNNVELIRILDLERGAPFGRYKGIDVGYLATARPPVSRDAFAKRLHKELGEKPQVMAFGPSTIRKLAVVSGGAAQLAGAAKDEGCDTYLTGETSHSAYHLAKEARINLICAGHYATETVGVQALGRHVKDRFGLTFRFFDAPTGY
jgi:dinuclear metal center YbgI/SA1388 family protein